MLTKIVRPDSFNFDQPVMSLIDVHARGVDAAWLTKSAAVLTKELSELRPEPGRTFVHLIALGDSETYGANRNGDLFPKEANVKYHKTFEKHANFYRHHRNKPHLGHKIYGNVKCAAYNPEMRRVELIVSIDNEAAPDTIQKIASGKDLAVSMACQVPFDLCTVCQNKASNKDEYCEHIEKYACQVLDDGRVVGMLNTQPKFFDISEVARNADRIAFSLQKVASAGDHVTGAQLAEIYGVTAPDAGAVSQFSGYAETLRKVAAVEAHIAQDIQQDAGLRAAAAALNHPVDLAFEKVTAEQTPVAVLGLLKRSGVCLPMESFFQLTLGDRFHEVAHELPAARAALPMVFREAEKNASAFVQGVKTYEALDLRPSVLLKKEVERVTKSASLSPEYSLERRLMHQALVKSAGVVPYEKGSHVTPAGRYLASEYGRYKLAFLHGADPRTVQLAVLQDF